MQQEGREKAPQGLRSLQPRSSRGEKEEKEGKKKKPTKKTQPTTDTARGFSHFLGQKEEQSSRFAWDSPPERAQLLLGSVPATPRPESPWRWMCGEHSHSCWQQLRAGSAVLSPTLPYLQAGLTKAGSCSPPRGQQCPHRGQGPIQHTRDKDPAQDSIKRVWFWGGSHEGSYGWFWVPTLPGYPAPGAFLACSALKDPRNEADGDTGVSKVQLAAPSPTSCHPRPQTSSKERFGEGLQVRIWPYGSPSHPILPPPVSQVSQNQASR